MLPPVAYARLWENLWSTGGGDALTQEDIARAFSPDLKPMTGKEPGWLFVSGIDLGLKRDCSAVVTLGIGKFGTPLAGRVRLATAKLWKPSPGKKVDFTEVERYIRELDKQYELEAIAFDPWQAELLAQRLELFTSHRRRNQRKFFGAKSWVREIPPTGTNLREIAARVIEYFTDTRLQLYEYPPLRTDLLKIRAEEKSYGLRLVSPRDNEGHGDTFSAFSLALMIGHELAGIKPVVAGGIESSAKYDPLAQAVKLFDYRRERYEEEQEQYGGEYDHNETINDYLRYKRNPF